MSTIVTSIVTPHYFLRIPFLFVAGITLLFVTIGVLITRSIVLTTNVINFGMDQLHDSSTQDSILFVHWYVWLNYLSLLVTGVPWSLYFHDFWYLDYVDEIRIVSLSLYIATDFWHLFIPPYCVHVCGSSQTMVVLDRIRW